MRESLVYELSSRVEFILRSTISRPVHLGIGLPFGTHDHILFLSFLNDNCFVVLLTGQITEDQ
jgi:hypothetical protein